jgi:hypothetical protein
MNKKKMLIGQIERICHDRAALEQFIIANSNLPGPRGNLELAFAVADVYDNATVVKEWTGITEDQAGVNDPRAFLPFCGAVCLGNLYTKQKKQAYITLLKQLAADGRWRMREAVAFGFQRIGEYDFGILERVFSGWIANAGNLERRAILAALAHPPNLNESTTPFCFRIADQVLRELDTTSDFDVLKKGLGFTISVFAAADSRSGFRFIEKWIGTDRVIDRILRENLKKKRLVRINPDRVAELLGRV